MDKDVIWHITPSTSIRISDIVRWKISGAELMPKGRRLKQYRSKGVTNVVSSFDSSLSIEFGEIATFSQLGKALVD